MNWYSILQSILTYVLTTFAVAVLTWAAKTSKRITRLEEHDKVQAESLSKLDQMLENQVRMDTKLDLILSGRLKLGDINDKN